MNQKPVQVKKNRLSTKKFNRLALSSAVCMALFGGYGRSAHAGSCTGTAPDFSCAGPADPDNDVTIELGDPTPIDGLSVTTEDGFGHDTSTSGGNAFTLRGNNGLTFTDNYRSSITGYVDGINARNAAGDLSLTLTGNITGTTGRGVYAYNDGSGGNLLIAHQLVDEEGDGFSINGGIVADNDGSGDLTIDLGASASVRKVPQDGYAIEADNGINGGSLSIVMSNNILAQGAKGGIKATNNGSGDLTITAVNLGGPNSDINTQGEAGVRAVNRGKDLSITVDRIIGSKGANKVTYGINADNYGSGSLTIVSQEVTAADKAGIRAVNSAAGADLSITSHTIKSFNEVGISADNDGSGSLTISAVDVLGISSSGPGIYADNSAAGVDLSIASTGTVTGGTYGIQADNNGTGSLTITAVDVTGISGPGIKADNSAVGVDLSIASTGTVTGGEKNGIDADNYGTGSLTISANNVTGSSGGDGIEAANSAAGVDLSITTTGVVRGGIRGINADNNGTGSLAITAVDVTGTSGPGIYADNSAAGVDLSIASTGAVTGSTTGIVANNNGTGSLTITANGFVAGVSETGIRAVNNAAGTDLSVISRGRVTGGKYGINVNNYGTGSLAISAVDVTGIVQDGIKAENRAGVDLSIASTGTVTGRRGIYANNSGTGNLTIDVNHVTGDRQGIYALNRGAGSLAITANHVTGNLDSGIKATNYSYGADLSITATVVHGFASGIDASNSGTRQPDHYRQRCCYRHQWPWYQCCQ